MRIVTGLGGNALLRRDEAPTAANQLANIAGAARALAPVIREHDVVLTHGNGPQIGLLALLDAGGDAARGQPLDVLGAQTEGLLGHLLAQAFRTEVRDLDLAVLLTQVRVDPGDPAFDAPSKPIGPLYTEAEAREVRDLRGWTMAPEGGAEGSWRRVVPSPVPLDIVELPAIRRLHEAGTTVVCAGGGGIPVAHDPDGRVRGLEAVVDKDASAALLAEGLGADLLVLLTDVPAVMRNFGTPEARPIRRLDAGEALALSEQLPGGSIGPKLRAVGSFVASTGREAVIGALEDAERVVGGRAGTRVLPR